jgi:hypothetical protein
MMPLIMSDPEEREHHPNCTCPRCMAGYPEDDQDEQGFVKVELTEKQAAWIEDGIIAGSDYLKGRRVIKDRWLKVTNNTAGFIAYHVDNTNYPHSFAPWEVRMYRDAMRRVDMALTLNRLAWTGKKIVPVTRAPWK